MVKVRGLAPGDGGGCAAGAKMGDESASRHSVTFSSENPLSAALMAKLKATKDSRVLGGADAFDKYPYYGAMPEKKTGQDQALIKSVTP